MKKWLPLYMLYFIGVAVVGYLWWKWQNPTESTDVTVITGNHESSNGHRHAILVRRRG